MDMDTVIIGMRIQLSWELVSWELLSWEWGYCCHGHEHCCHRNEDMVVMGTRVMGMGILFAWE